MICLFNAHIKNSSVYSLRNFLLLSLSFLDLATASIPFTQPLSLLSNMGSSTSTPLIDNSSPRQTIISGMSSSVTGTYNLYDTLSITTISGSVNIIVVPQPAANDAASSSSAIKPADLRIKTTSGSISVTVDAQAAVAANRTFTTSISSMSGRINAPSLIHGLSTSLSTASGSINAEIHPFTGPDMNITTSRSDLSLKTFSGNQNIQMNPSLNFPTKPIRNLFTNINHQSGSVSLTFPLTWEGSIRGSTMSGNINYDWPGLRILKQGGGVFEAVKGGGEGKGLLSFGGMSGNVRLVGNGGQIVEGEEVGREGQGGGGGFGGGSGGGQIPLGEEGGRNGGAVGGREV